MVREWVSEWESEWVSEWVIEWVSKDSVSATQLTTQFWWAHGFVDVALVWVMGRECVYILWLWCSIKLIYVVCVPYNREHISLLSNSLDQSCTMTY